MADLFDRLMDNEIARAEERRNKLVEKMAEETQWAKQSIQAGRGISVDNWVPSVIEILQLDQLIYRLGDLRDARDADKTADEE